ncbi:MAG: hypothetical protein IJ428_05725 [Clostridia bacterium]|nr:hypothetical protein [Clostridia bacterium]
MNTTDNNMAVSNTDDSTVFMSVPALPPNTTPPAVIHAITIVNKSDEPNIMRIIVKRDLSMPIRSFTFRYRFSTLPIYAPDSEHLFSTFTYTESDINTSELISISGSVPDGLKYSGCSAYISEIVLESGQALTFDAGEYKYIRHPVKKQRHAPQTSADTASAQAVEMIKQSTVTEPALQKKKRIRRTIILTALILMLIVEAIGGVFLYRYLGVRNSVDSLIKEERFNEAYKIAQDSEYTGLLQRVCEKASLHYFSEGDLESSYVYAYGAPKPFTDMIIDYAAQSVIDNESGKINENAFRVAKMSESDEKFDSIIHTMVGMLEAQGDFPNALRVVSELRNEDDRIASEDTIFTNAFSYFSSNHRYYEAALFIDDLENVTTVNRSKAEIIDFALDCFASSRDNAGIIYLAHRYPEYADASLAQTEVKYEDAGVRAELEIVYPMLSASQKRSYHAKTLALWNGELKRIENGTLVGTDITNAVSVETNADVTLVLLNNGSVITIANKGAATAYTIPQYNDVVAIALGDTHAVLLHENGTVSVHGDNSYGQADTSAWTDIAAIAAGQRFTVGLRIDGTVVAVGSNTCGQCDTAIWRNVVDVAACNQSTVLLFSDGSVEVQGYRSLGLADVETLTDVKRIEAGGAAIVAERTDGTYVLYSGQTGGDPGDPYNWRNIDTFDVGLMCIAAIDKSNVLYTDGEGLPS